MTFDTSIRDTRKKLLDVVNGCGLHIDIIECMLEALLANVHRQAELAYQMSLEQEEKDGTDES